MNDRQSQIVFALVAGEKSGDLLGADLIRGLKARYPHARFVGIGGENMQVEGLESWFEMEQLSVMGLFEVLKYLPKLLRLRKRLIKKLREIKPHAFIGIDAPDFNFYVERQLKQAGIKTIHYVGPSVWAWRENRLEKIKKSVDGVLVLFPFEPTIYDRYQIPVKFVGHPLANQVPDEPNSVQARQTLGLALDMPVTALLPGSRMSEIDRMADPYIQAAKKIALIHPNMQFVIPCVHQAARARIEESVKRYGAKLSIKLIDQQSQTVMEACDQMIVTSGTATLQAALMMRPMVIAIKVHPVSYWIMKRLAISKWIGLPNILAQQDVAVELIQHEVTPDKLALELGRLILDKSRRETQLKAFRVQRSALKQDSASLAAQAVIDWAELN
ncbi:lipid-A-disaccharide synthase [Thiomicrospira sp.]|uniref:lipid-A-disaccharide synthase n=1 Tax=Thiomicrospira sp. TaxID=935 RepID=UPI002F921B0D